MKKFEYQQVEYSKYPSPEELNEEGMDGWEVIFMDKFEKEVYDPKFHVYYTKKIYRVTFKREIE